MVDKHGIITTELLQPLVCEVALSKWHCNVITAQNKLNSPLICSLLYIICTFASYSTANSLRLSLKLPAFLIQYSFCLQLPCLKSYECFIRMSHAGTITVLWKMLSSLNVTYFPFYLACYYFFPANLCQITIKMISNIVHIQGQLVITLNHHFSHGYAKQKFYVTELEWFTWCCRSCSLCNRATYLIYTVWYFNL